jgi:hypothetical protein
MLKELLGIFEISVGNFMRDGCHVELVGANPTRLKSKLHTCLKSRIPEVAFGFKKCLSLLHSS